MATNETKKLPLPVVPAHDAPVAPPAPTVATVAVALSRAPVAVKVGTACMCHGVTFRAPCDGLMRTSDKNGAGWPAVPVGTDFYVVAAVYHVNGQTQAAAVVVTAVPNVGGTTGNGGKSGEWKAWPFTGGRLRMRDRAGKPVDGAE